MIVSDEKTMLERLYHRNGLDDTHARLMIRSQMPLDEKCRRAAVVIRNEGNLEQLYSAVDQVLEQRRPSRIIHTFGLWAVPISSAVALSAFAAYKLYNSLTSSDSK